MSIIVPNPPPTGVTLRHAPRHVHETVADHVQAGLTTLGWLTAGNTPFGVEPVVLKRTAGKAADIAAGQVRISMGDEYMPTDEEMEVLWSARTSRSSSTSS